MIWNDDIMEKIKTENIDNIEAKKKVAETVAQKVKDGQIIRIWFWFDIFYGNNFNCGKGKKRKHSYNSNTNIFRDKNALYNIRDKNDYIK